MVKYKKIQKDIEKKIESGEYVVNEKLPSEVELSKEYQVSQSTIKRVMQILIKNGYIYRRRGDGTYANDLQELDYLKTTIEKQFSGFTNVNHGKKHKHRRPGI